MVSWKRKTAWNKPTSLLLLLLLFPSLDQIPTSSYSSSESTLSLFLSSVFHRLLAVAMYRPALMLSSPSQRWHEALARLMFPLTLWICVSVSIRYGFYGDSRMVLGPSSSRLMKASSVFVEQVEIRDDNCKGMQLYSFSEKPELTLETNWSVSNYLIVASYSRKGFSLWLNRGSKISMRWETHKSALNQLQVLMIKGDRKHETLLPTFTDSPSAEPLEGREAEFVIEEDDKYFLGFVNSNGKSIIMTLNLNVSSKSYDISRANSICSATNGSCKLTLQFPSTQYVVLTTPDDGSIGGWYVELSFVARVVTYIAILGLIMIVVFLILKYLGTCDTRSTAFVETTPLEIRVSETTPILPEKPTSHTYGTGDDDEESGASSSSSEELYDDKLCVICYDEQRNCFFVPCGHCATCYDCAQRIMEGESKVCPICRRLIHKVRKLFNS